MKVGNRIKTRNGFFGIITQLFWTAAASSTCSFISRVEIKLDHGKIILIDPALLEVVDDTGR